VEKRFQKYYSGLPEPRWAIDLRRINVDDAVFEIMEPRIHKAFADRDPLKNGTLAHLGRNRMVDSYWSHNPKLVPPPENSNFLRFSRASFNMYHQNK
jgi:hypothetical protein